MAMSYVMTLLLPVAILTCWSSAPRPTVNDGSDTLSVLIVGGGAAGIAAASKLVKGGITDFLVVEGGAELGGRVASKEVGDCKVELGAQFIHGEEGNIVHELAKKWGMLPEHEENSLNQESIYDDGRVMEKILVKTFSSMCEEILISSYFDDTSTYSSLGHYFEDKFEKKLEETVKNETLKQQGRDYLQFFGKAWAMGESVGSWFELGIAMDTFEQSPGYQYGGFKKGYSYLDFLEKLGSEINMTKHVRFNEKVQSITDRDSHVKVETSRQNYTCQHVIITVSLGVLKHGGITFNPPLPAPKQAAIDNIGFGTIGKVFLEYPQSWTEITNHSQFRYSLLRRNEKSWTDNPGSSWEEGVVQVTFDSKNPSVATLWTIGHSAKKASLLPPGQLLNQSHTMVKKFLFPTHEFLPSPISVFSPPWSTNPLILGAYSFNSPSFSPGDRETLAEPVGRKFFAGEATSIGHHATVHGAIETGWREAERILDTL